MNSARTLISVCFSGRWPSVGLCVECLNSLANKFPAYYFSCFSTSCQIAKSQLGDTVGAEIFTGCYVWHTVGNVKNGVNESVHKYWLRRRLFSY